jgi:release factor glutamine methyltransferase
MSANLQPKTPAIKDWLADASSQLRAAGIASARLDSEIILAHTLRKSRTYLHAHDNEPINERQLEIADTRLLLRLDRTPIAYIIGHKEFYGRLFKVTPATLIPRPESEDIITIIKESIPATTPLIHTNKKLVDVGTGTGCLGITAKLEVPDLDVTLLDVSKHALNVAEQNAKQLRAIVTTTHSDLLANFPFIADYIVANLPYVDPQWERSPETSFEPEIALFASNHGLHLIFKLLSQTPRHLAKAGLLLLEADPRQHTAIISEAKNHGLIHKETRGFIVCLQQS